MAYLDMVYQGQVALAVQEAAQASIASCGLDKSCIENAIREKIKEDRLDVSVLGSDTKVTIRGVDGAYTELVFNTTMRGAGDITQKMCDLDFPNRGQLNGRGACPGNAGYTILAGPVHPGTDFIFRDHNPFNGLNIHVGVDTVKFDIDPANPTGGLLPMIIHGIQAIGNRITGRDTTYRRGM